jgi:hypothetical protein
LITATQKRLSRQRNGGILAMRDGRVTRATRPPGGHRARSRRRDDHAMMRLVRGTPVVRAVLAAVAAIFALWGLVAVAMYPLLRVDAASYERAAGSAAAECPGDPIPARGGCWSAAPARVTISGVDHSGGADVAFVVVAVQGQAARRADLVDATRIAALPTGTTLSARWWHEDIAVLALPGASTGAAPTLLPTRDNPSYRATRLPIGDAVTLLLGAGGLLLWGRPLLADVREWRARRRGDSDGAGDDSAAGPAADGEDVTSAPGFGRGLARYGIDLRTTEVTLTGQRATPPSTKPGATTKPGGSGWNIRPQ